MKEHRSVVEWEQPKDLEKHLSHFLSVHREIETLIFVLYASCVFVNCVDLSKNVTSYRGADKSLARPGRKQARKHVRDSRDFNNIETRAAIKFFFLQGKAPKEIHAILT